jgi:hypothetical protein
MPLCGTTQNIIVQACSLSLQVKAPSLRKCGVPKLRLAGARRAWQTAPGCAPRAPRSPAAAPPPPCPAARPPGCAARAPQRPLAPRLQPRQGQGAAPAIAAPRLTPAAETCGAARCQALPAARRAAPPRPAPGPASGLQGCRQGLRRARRLPRPAPQPRARAPAECEAHRQPGRTQARHCVHHVTGFFEFGTLCI